MSSFKVFEIAGSGMSAQSLRLNITASNLANAESVSGNAQGVYRAREPVFSAVMESVGDESPASVRVLGVVENNAPVQMRYEPGHPLADAQGYIYMPNVNMVEQMANMISASRSYQNNVEVLNTSKQLLLATLRMGQ
ncbi:MAG: flagellar basal body rod protein FlgC [Pseudomonadota bacterium]